MPKLFSARQVMRALSRVGFSQVSQRGSHIKLKKLSERGEIVVIVPNYREIAEGTMKSILEQAKLSREEFERFALK